jgi:ubiquinone/menaquinone biosynthesis C-methylase UbiE
MKKRLNQSQKEIFLHSEGDAWYARNRNIINVKNYLNDPIVKSIQKIVECESPSKTLSILEIGCGDGARLSFIKNLINCKCFGIDPSAQAVREANLKGVCASIGTAEKLPFEKQVFDIVIYGFCLYLCDREDLFEIASESNRVLKKESWLIIHDFFDPYFSHQKYEHIEGIHSYKMDYKSLFEWSPFYTCYFQSIDKHGSTFYTDEKNEWVQTAVLRKKITTHGP